MDDSHYNPCLVGRKPWLAPVGDFLASLMPECPCCAAVRGLLFGAATGVAGLIIGALVW